MKTIGTIFSLIILVTGTACAQQYRTSLNEGQDYTLKLADIEASIEVVAHNHPEIIVDASELPKVPEKAKGLRPLMTGSAVDNTGIGLNMKIIDNVIAFSSGRPSSSLRYQIKIPPKVNLYLYSENYDTACYIFVNGLSGEVEIDIRKGDINLTDITGPLMVKVNSGDITVKFSEVNQESPMSLVCNEGDIDVTMPDESATTFRLKASSGEVFTDLDITQQEDPFLADFSIPILKSPGGNFQWSYSLDSSFKLDLIKQSRAMDIQSILVDKDKNQIHIREKRPGKKEKDQAILYYNAATAKDMYDEAISIYDDNLGNFNHGHDFPFFLSLTYDFTGTINGGGVEIGIRTDQGNIYLRKSD